MPKLLVHTYNAPITDARKMNRNNATIMFGVLKYPLIRGELTVFVNLYANTDFMPSSSREEDGIQQITILKFPDRE
jgi:hypothetical protein